MKDIFQKLYYVSISCCMVFLLQLMEHPLNAQTKSQKKGLAYGNLSILDLDTISTGLSWWYNWSESPDAAVSTIFQDRNMDFVPMAWGANFNATALNNYYSSHPNDKFLLGFNEPNFLNQSKLTPSQAAALWPQLETIASKYGLKIVSPAVNYCGTCVTENGVTYTDPVQYLDDFFSACVNCQVDYIAVHNYMCYAADYSSYIALFKKYKKPIWLTEFACWDQSNITLGMQKSLMLGAMDYLESDSMVFRYAWFTGDRSGSYPFLDIFDYDAGALTPLGELYVHYNPVHNTNSYTTIPARIEAENYSTQHGTFNEATSDVDGVADVGWIDPGDWLEYNIDVPQDGNYYVYFRVAGVGASSIQLKEGTNLLGSINVPVTGGYQTWSTISTQIYLSQGTHKLTLYTPTGLFNLNWINITQDVLSSLNTAQTDNSIYPNPVKDNLYITNDANTNITVVSVIDQLGKTRFNKTFAAGTKTMTIDFSALEKGCFIVRIQNQATITSHIVIKQ